MPEPLDYERHRLKRSPRGRTFDQSTSWFSVALLWATVLFIAGHLLVYQRLPFN